MLRYHNEILRFRVQKAPILYPELWSRESHRDTGGPISEDDRSALDVFVEPISHDSQRRGPDETLTETKDHGSDDEEAQRGREIEGTSL